MDKIESLHSVSQEDIAKLIDLIKNTTDERILFPGYVYGDDTNILMKNAYAYIQPSLIEGLSPVILTVMGLGAPLLCSDIVENKFICRENATTFISGDADDLANKIRYILDNTAQIKLQAAAGVVDISSRFNWDKITDQYIELLKKSDTMATILPGAAFFLGLPLPPFTVFGFAFPFLPFNTILSSPPNVFEGAAR